MNRILTEDLIKAYQRKLEDEEKAKLTVQKYIRDIQKFYRFLPDKKILPVRGFFPINNI